MAGNPNSGDVYNNAASMRFDSRTPGMNAFLAAWAALQDFAASWGPRTYSEFANVTNLIREIY